MSQVKNSSPDPTMPTMMGGTPDAAMGMPSGPTPEMGPTSTEMEESEPESTPTPTGGATGDPKTDGLKRQLLQKMMENLLNKPGRSVNELVNGVKAVIGAYKNYSKEWDNLSGVSEAPLPPEGSSPSAGGSSSEIQAILDKIKSQKGEMVQGATPPGLDSTAIPPPPPIGPMDKGPSGMGGPGYKQPAPINRLGIYGY
jgi:hypothetical protein